MEQQHDDVGTILVANTYAEVFYTNLGLQQPVGDKLWINDLSLIKGGKYDLGANWCISCSHFEHLVGTNVDVASNNVPAARWDARSSHHYEERLRNAGTSGNSRYQELFGDNSGCTSVSSGTQIP